MMRRRFIAAGAVATLLPLVASVSAQSVDPPGRSAFRTRCGGCHLERGFGTRVLSRRVDPALLELRTDLQADYVRTVVRHGVGSMPMLREAELGDDELGRIAAYLARETIK